MSSGYTWGATSPVSLRICPLCHQQGQVFKSGRLKHGPQRYICRACQRSFQLESLKKQVNRQRVIELYMEGKSHPAITAETGLSSTTISRIVAPFRARRTGKHCPACGGENISRFGKTRGGQQRFRCKECLRTFNETPQEPDREKILSAAEDITMSDIVKQGALLELDGVLYEAMTGPNSDGEGVVYAPVITPESHYSVHTFSGEPEGAPVAIAPDITTAVDIALLTVSYAGGSAATIVMESRQAVTHDNPQEWLCEV